MRSGAIASGLLACLALLSALAPPAVSAPGQNYCRGVVLYDMAHGETDGRYTDGMDCGISVPELLEEWGCQVELNYQPLDQVDLSGYDLLVIYSPHSEFSDAETAAIEEYVRRGGSLLLLVDTQMAYGNQSQVPNQVAEKFGARFAGDEWRPARSRLPTTRSPLTSATRTSSTPSCSGTPTCPGPQIKPRWS